MTTKFITLRLTQTAAALAAATVLAAGTAGAWHPLGFIQKDVEDITTGSDVRKADSQASALVVHPGDTLVFHITVLNQADGQDDQMVNTKITDTLPNGLELVSQESFDLGTINPRQNIQRTVKVKVSDDATGIIKNQACFTGESAEHTYPQSGCDVAYVQVITPTPSPSATPTPTATTTPSPTPSHTPTPSTPSPTPTSSGEVLGTETTTETLPDTGGESLVAATIGIGAMVGAGVAYIRSRRKM